MPKALFYNVPGHGHVNPSLPLVAELVRRGHSITYFATESFRSKIEQTGVTFQAYAGVPDDYFERSGLHGGVAMKVARHLMTTTEEILPGLLDSARAERPDYVLYDGMCPWGYMVARALGVPAVTSLALMPTFTPPLSALMTYLPLILPMLVSGIGDGIAADRKARALGAEYGVPALGLSSIMNAYGDLCISYTSTYFQPYAERVSNNIRFVGRILDDVSSFEPSLFERVGDRRLIYISLGTVNNDNPALFTACIEAFGGSKDFVLITTGNRFTASDFGTLPENIAIHGWVPQYEVLKRASLFITHAGLNSVHDGLYFGVPLLLVPQQGEQTMTAMRVAELGAGKMLKKGQVSAQTLRDTASMLLSDARYKTEAIRIGESFRTAGGAQRAADEIEAILRANA